MKMKLAFIFLFISSFFIFSTYLSAQDLGPLFKKVKDVLVERTEPWPTQRGIPKFLCRK
jgi:hypothetical protein